MATSWLLDAIWKTALCIAHKGNVRCEPVKLPQRRQRVNTESKQKYAVDFCTRSVCSVLVFSRISIGLQAIQFLSICGKIRSTTVIGRNLESALNFNITTIFICSQDRISELNRTLRKIWYKRLFDRFRFIWKLTADSFCIM